MVFPSRKDDRVFRWASKLLPLVAWAIGLAIFCPTWIKSNGQFGLECKSMTCRWISKDENGNPTTTAGALKAGMAMAPVAVVAAEGR